MFVENIIRRSLLAPLQSMLFLLISCSPVEAREFQGEPSIVQVPIIINLDLVQEQFNQALPQILETIDMRGHKCVEAEYLKTKGIPKCKMRGIKIYCKDTWLKTKVTPDIKCDLSGWVKRNGPASITGSGSSITVSVPVQARVTARGRGDIGKNVRETAEAALVVTATATPSIDSNWNPTFTVNSSFSWSKRPELKIFDFIPVTFGSKMEPRIRGLLDEMEKSVPDLLANANVKGYVKEAWEQLHKPIVIDEENEVSVVIDPSHIAFKGMETNERKTYATFAIGSNPTIYVGEDPKEISMKPLPSLSLLQDHTSDIRLTIPIVAAYNKLAERGEAALGVISPIELSQYGQSGELTIDNLGISAVGTQLHIEVDFSLDNNEGLLDLVDFFGLLDVEGRASFTVGIENDTSTRVLRLSSIEFDLVTNNSLADALVELAMLQPIRELIRTSISYEYADDLERVKAIIGKELNKRITSDVSVRGSVADFSIGQMTVHQDSLSVPIQLIGVANVLVGDQDE